MIYLVIDDVLFVKMFTLIRVRELTNDIWTDTNRVTDTSSFTLLLDIRRSEFIFSRELLLIFHIGGDLCAPYLYYYFLLEVFSLFFDTRGILLRIWSIQRHLPTGRGRRHGNGPLRPHEQGDVCEGRPGVRGMLQRRPGYPGCSMLREMDLYPSDAGSAASRPTAVHGGT